MKPPSWVIPGSAVLFLAACALLQSPVEKAHSVAAAGGFVPVELPDPRLRGFVRPLPAGTRSYPRVTIYFESDGAQWRVPTEPPADPTPVKPLVLGMAVDDSSPAVAYVARPCQYLPAAELRQCDPQLWMRARFSGDAIGALDAAVDRIKKDYGAREVNLVGLSGGGVVATLLAERRSDVSCLVTVASALDTTAWTTALDVSPLNLSLNPLDNAARLSKLRQTHFQGLRDTVVPPATTARFLAQVPNAQVIDKEKFDHRCCWAEEWKQLRQASCLAQQP